jgi:hypothetical protein
MLVSGSSHSRVTDGSPKPSLVVITAGRIDRNSASGDANCRQCSYLVFWVTVQAGVANTKGCPYATTNGTLMSVA